MNGPLPFGYEPPGSWEVKPFGRIVSRRQDIGQSHLQPLSVFLDAGVVPRASRDDNFNRLGSDLGKYLAVKPGDLVFNKLRTWQGGLGVSKYEGIVSPAYFVCRPRHGAESRFLHYLLRSRLYLEELTRISKWMPPSQFDIAWGDLSALPVLLPALDEQRAIADYLDRETARIDALIAAKERMIGLLAERFAELIEAELWNPELAPLSAIKRHLTQKITDGPHETPEFMDDGLPFISIEAVVDDELDFSRARFISHSAHVEYSRKVAPQRGDVLLAKTGATIGKTAVVRTDQQFSIWSPLALLRPRAADLQPDYLWYVLRTRSSQELIRESATQSTQPNISMPDIAALPIRVPNVAVQDQLLARITRHGAPAKRMTSALEAQVALLREHRQTLITTAVTGSLKIPVAA